ncbi:MAG: hypothetical protein GY715_04850 [Planctomycetes bacterium]|nr:hypothetical protein [Planctomycetota bacterium]
MTKSTKKPGAQRPFWAQVFLRVQQEALSVYTWAAVGLVAAGVLFALKYWQTRLSNAGITAADALDHAFSNRINDPSLWCLLAGVIVGFALVFPVYDLRAAERLDDSVPFSRGATVGFLLSLIAMWALYIQAVARDGGTFFWAKGDGGTITTVACLPDTIPRDQLGPMFSGQLWSALPQDRRDDLLFASTNSEGLMLVQVIEGVTFLFVLGIWAFIGVLVNIYVSRIGTLTIKHRGTLLQSAVRQLLGIATFPIILLTGLSAVKIAINWSEGIQSAFLAGATAIAMWIPLGVAWFRLLKNGGPVIMWGKSGPQAPEP